MSKNLIIDLGCGLNKQLGAVGVDNVKLQGVDIVHDLKKFPYPFKKNSADKIYLYQVLEHFDPDRRLKVLREIHRILKPGGILDLRVPHVFSVGSFQDPTHRSFFTYFTIDYLTNNHFFSYYGEKNVSFELLYRGTGINLFKDFTKLNRFNILLNQIASGFLQFLLKHFQTLPDLAVKVLPFFYVEIIWHLRKPLNDK